MCNTTGGIGGASPAHNGQKWAAEPSGVWRCQYHKTPHLFPRLHLGLSHYCGVSDPLRCRWPCGRGGRTGRASLRVSGECPCGMEVPAVVGGAILGCVVLSMISLLHFGFGRRYSSRGSHKCGGSCADASGRDGCRGRGSDWSVSGNSG